jgi:hypothetical protein
MNLQENIHDAKKRLREMKRSTPWIFNEYQQLMAIRERHAMLTRMLEKAEQTWKELGK